jgi:hypothetical protein
VDFHEEESKMAKLTRRGLLKTTSIGAATVGVLAAGFTAAPRLAAMAAPSDATTELSAASVSGPMVAYVRDLARGEVGVLVGEREIIYRDPDFVMRLLKAAAQ